jgi:crotonobetainyl-CoA:carnitine CoA-transferase CaiB-like acyl-CoA transferase
MLASGGAGRFLAAYGADVIRVEHLSRVDGMRYSVGRVPLGGRAERDAATEPLTGALAPEDYDKSGNFMEINAGKRSLSLNLRSGRGKEILEELIATCDVLLEGFSPGTLERMGFGYETLKKVQPAIVYVQQSGMGQSGVYGRMRTYGPVAAAFAGITDMSGLSEPYPPAGIGYSYLDWFGAYNMAIAVLAALYRRRTTGQGCWIDSSQVESGVYLTGTAILDYQVNGRPWKRYGNRSPYKPASPHGAYPVRGRDRWIAICCFTQDEWSSLVATLGAGHLLNVAKFDTLSLRIRHAEELDSTIGELTRIWDGYELMQALQTAGVAAGVCQTAEDRCDNDPQLRHLGWQVELPQQDLGVWPVKEVPYTLARTPAYVGGPYDRSGPSYGQDTEAILTELLKLDAAEIERLRDEDVI